MENKKKGRLYLSTDPDHTTDVLAKVVVNLHRPTWKMGLEAGINHSSVARILQWNKYHPYGVTCIHSDNCDIQLVFGTG
jgi:hypothetical protein